MLDLHLREQTPESEFAEVGLPSIDGRLDSPERILEVLDGPDIILAWLRGSTLLCPYNAC
jgi:hypothetical protein